MAVFIFLTGLLVFSQGTRADYERAERLRFTTSNKVFRDRVKANWLTNNTQFWYRIRTGMDTYEYIFVDAVRGEHLSAFDHTKMASALKNIGVSDARADKLPIELVSIDPQSQTAHIRANNKYWICDLKTYTFSETAETASGASISEKCPPLERVPTASRRTGAETQLTFINKTEWELELIWIDSDGNHRSYGKIAPGATRAQHTFAGHSWLLINEKGEPIAAFEAIDEPAECVIDGKRRPQPAGNDRNRRAAPARQQAADGVSPDKQYLAFIRENNLFLYNQSTKEELQLTTDGTPTNFYTDRFFWSPDSKYLITMRTLKGDERKIYLIESSPTDQLQPKLHTVDYLKPGDRIDIHTPALFEISSKKQIKIDNSLFPNPWSISHQRWRADSKGFRFIYNERGHQIMRVLELDPATGNVRPIIEEKSDTFIDYNGKFYVRFIDETDEIIWMSERDGWNHLYLFDGRTGRLKNQITKGQWVVRAVDNVDEKNRQIWFRAGGIYPEQDPYYIHYCRVNFDGSNLVILTEGDGTHTIEFSPDRRFIIDTYSRVDMPPVIELRSAETGKKICDLEKADWKELLATGWIPPERFTAKGRDGVTDIYGIIIRPTTFDPNKKYPVIEHIYAGPQGAFVPKQFSAYYEMQYIAELGFIVVQIDGMGTSYRSKKFHNVCWKNLADSGFPDRILWIKEAAKTRPWMDISRVGIYGGSAGGQSSTRALIDHGDFYKVAVSDCGCHDNRMDKIWWNELWMGWPVGPHYGENSNVTYAHKITGKLLLIVGELDRNVDPASTMQVVNALVKANKDFDLLVLPGVGHGAAETPYGKRRRADFFVRHLLGVEPRAN